MGVSVTVDPDTRIIDITKTPGPGQGVFGLDLSSINVLDEIYSALKDDWLNTVSLQGLRFPLEPVGGDPISDTEELGRYVFLRNQDGWRVRPYDGDHELKIIGNMFPRDPDQSLWLSQPGRTIVIQTERSALATSLQQEALEFSSYGGAVTVDATSSFAGTSYPTGTLQAPVNNVADALAIALDRGISAIRFRSDVTLDSGDFTGMNILGVGGRNNVHVTVEAGATVFDAKFQDVTVDGVFGDVCNIRNCVVDDLMFPGNFIENSVLRGEITLFGSLPVYIFNCKDGDPGAGTPVLDHAVFTGSLSVRGFFGGIELKNKTTSDTAAFDFSQGRLVVDSSNTDGVIRVRNAKVTGVTGGSVIDDASYLTQSDVWFGANDALTRILGSQHENSYLDQHVWDTINGKTVLKSARERTYDTEANATAHSATGLLHTYQVTCEYDANGDQTSFLRTRVGS